MRVLIAGPYPLPKTPPYGGVGRVTTVLTDFLSKHEDLKIEVLSRGEDIKKDFVVDKGKIRINHFAKKKPRVGSSIVRDLPALKHKIKEINPDLIHAQGVVEAMAGIRAGIPTVMTLHGIVWKTYKFENGLKSLGRAIIYTILTKYVLKKLKYLILISPYIEEEAGSFIYAKKYLIENPLSENFFEIENKETRKNIFYLGTITPRKDALALIKAMSLVKKEVPEAELRIIGKVTDLEYYKLLKSYVSNNNLANCVRFIDQLQDKEIEEEYARCSLLCLPSREEVAPMVIAEALASGKPVVATNICGIPYMVDNGKTGFLFEPGNVQSLAEKIITLLQDDDLRHKMGKRAKEVARERWSADIIAKKTIDVYTEILTRAGKKF